MNSASYNHQLIPQKPANLVPAVFPNAPFFIAGHVPIYVHLYSFYSQCHLVLTDAAPPRPLAARVKCCTFTSVYGVCHC